MMRRKNERHTDHANGFFHKNAVRFAARNLSVYALATLVQLGKWSIG